MFGPATPILRSFDERMTKGFYVDFLGFEVEFEHRFEPGMPLYMGLRRDECRVHLSEHFGDAAPGARLRIRVEDVRSFARSLNEKQYGHARPGEPDLMDWGSWEITINDPAGNRLTFYTEDKV